MIGLLQRVQHAAVAVDGEQIAAIGAGLLVLVGVQKGDSDREADRLLAEAIRIIAGLYQDDVVAKPEAYAYAFPDLLTFHDSPTPIENRLFVMHLKHRMRAFQGTFHANPDYALWYGWSEMIRDLSEIRHMAAEMRAAKGH